MLGISKEINPKFSRSLATIFVLNNLRFRRNNLRFHRNSDLAMKTNPF